MIVKLSVPAIFFHTISTWVVAAVSIDLRLLTVPRHLGQSTDLTGKCVPWTVLSRKTTDLGQSTAPRGRGERCGTQVGGFTVLGYPGQWSTVPGQWIS